MLPPLFNYILTMPLEALLTIFVLSIQTISLFSLKPKRNTTSICGEYVRDYRKPNCTLNPQSTNFIAKRQNSQALLLVLKGLEWIRSGYRLLRSGKTTHHRAIEICKSSQAFITSTDALYKTTPRQHVLSLHL